MRMLAVVAVLFVSRAAPAEEIVVGQVAALSGPARGLGEGMRAGLAAAIAEANARGGVHGRKLRLVSADDGYEPDATVDKTVQLIEKEKVFVLAGYVGTPTTKVAVPIAQDAKVPMVGIFSGAMLLREPVKRYIVNVRASYDDEGEALVAHSWSTAKRIAVFYQNDSFGLAGLSAVEKALKKRGGSVVAKGSFERNTLAVKGGLAEVMAGKPDAVVIVAPYAPMAAFVREARGAGLGAKMMTISFVGTENLLSALGQEAEGIVISQVVPSPEDASVPVVAEYVKAMPPGAPRSFVSLEGYVSGRVLVAALEAAGPSATREQVIDALEAMNIDLGGMRIAFSKDDHQGSRLVFLTEVRGGKAQPVVGPQAVR